MKTHTFILSGLREHSLIEDAEKLIIIRSFRWPMTMKERARLLGISERGLRLKALKYGITYTRRSKWSNNDKDTRK